MDPDEVRALLMQNRAADLITVTAHGLTCTLLPFVFEPGVGEHGALFGHVARNNEQWRHPALPEALVVVRGPDAYVSPSWYASKAKHGRVVPTWNYVQAHVYGQLVVHDDVDWLATHVRRLTAVHEAGLDHPWAVGDAPPDFIVGQLRAIVGVELRITRIEAKAKLSQNRAPDDVDGVVAGLRTAGRESVAVAVEMAGRDAAKPTAMPKG